MRPLTYQTVKLNINVNKYSVQNKFTKKSTVISPAISHFLLEYKLQNKKSNECERERGEDGGLPEGYRLAFVCAPGWRGCTPCWRTLASLRSRTRRGSCSHKGRTCLPHRTYKTNIKLLYLGNIS